jgi:murein DD-endopeptidase MepM/ murein hydrolase activator NlpD
MQYIVMNQNVRRRRKHTSFFFSQFRTSGTGKAPGQKSFRYIDGIKQHPASLKRPKKKPFTAGIFERRPPRQKPKEAAKKRVFAFPTFRLPAWMRNSFWTSPAPACVLGLIALASALILGAQNVPVTALSPGRDESIGTSLASYAGVAGALPVPREDTGLIPLDMTEVFHWETYRVRAGDSVSTIAARHSISMDAIIASNGITNVRRLREGELLRIPNMDGIPYTVKPRDTLSGISAAMDVPVEVILDANDMDSETITVGMSLFVPGAKMNAEDLRLALGDLFAYPVRGRLSSPYGWRSDPINGQRRFHAALDLAANTGTPVGAPMDGRVSTVGLNSVYGKYIILSHTGGFQTLYAHLNTVSVAQGSYVSRGTKIGEVGSTGYSTGPHLHFAIYKNGKPVNPLEYLR